MKKRGRTFTTFGRPRRPGLMGISGGVVSEDRERSLRARACPRGCGPLDDDDSCSTCEFRFEQLGTATKPFFSSRWADQDPLPEFGDG